MTRFPSQIAKLHALVQSVGKVKMFLDLSLWEEAFKSASNTGLAAIFNLIPQVSGDSDTRDCWVLVLCPSSGILKSKEFPKLYLFPSSDEEV
jgi:hypothetical protein